jgi:4-hydroxybenzoyl-CoA thioesterase
MLLYQAPPHDGWWKEGRMALSIREKRTVEWCDCDPLGIMFYPQCFTWFDTATHHLFEAAGLAMNALEARFGIVGLPLVDVGASFKSPLPWLTRIEIESTVAEWRTKSLVVRHTIRKGDVLAVEGQEIRVCVARAADKAGALRGVAIPDALKAPFEAAS